MFLKKITIALPLFFCQWLVFAVEKSGELAFPLALSAYQDGEKGIAESLLYRIEVEPFNLIVSLIFLCAIIHAFFARKITKISHRVNEEHQKKNPKTVSIKAEFLHFFGEVEAIFGIWVLVLSVSFIFFKDWHSLVAYINQVNYTEPVFVVVIMAIAASKPIVNLAGNNLRFVAGLFGGSIAAYWFCILTVAPLLGSFITEPAAMTVAALLLGRQFYSKKPSQIFAYSTLGLLFVNISIGGTLTNFAAPPVLIVANTWDWDIVFMMKNFGWKAVLSILVSNTIYFFLFRKEFQKMKQGKLPEKEKIPFIITFIHILFIVWTVFTAHYIPLFVGGFLFFLAFALATKDFQSPIDLKPPILVGFFLAGLVVHGGLQGWWLEPILSNLTEFQLFTSAVILTAFNDNAAITYLSSLVPNFSDSMKYAVVSGAVAGGGLTVIANAPNPAGQSILSKYFKGGISPLGLAIGALIPTLITSFFFLIFS